MRSSTTITTLTLVHEIKQMGQSETLFCVPNANKTENLAKTCKDKVLESEVSEKDLTLQVRRKVSGLRVFVSRKEITIVDSSNQLHQDF